jgi:CheY-like chemotaxis protein
MNPQTRFAFLSLLVRMEVLVIDNDPESGKKYSYLLEDYGATVKLLSSLEEAVRKLDWLTPDIVICEMSLLDHSVRALRKKLREIEMKTGRHIPVIFPTGSYVTDDAGVAQFTDSMHIKLLQAVGCDYARAQRIVTR